MTGGEEKYAYARTSCEGQGLLRGTCGTAGLAARSEGKGGGQDDVVLPQKYLDECPPAEIVYGKKDKLKDEPEIETAAAA
jgi:hypothetical protein